MDSINNGGYYPDNPNNKEAIIKKIQEEAALANLHKLVQVLRSHHQTPFSSIGFRGGRIFC